MGGSKRSRNSFITLFSHIHIPPGWWFQPTWKILVKIGNLPQTGVKIKNLWNHHPATYSPRPRPAWLYATFSHLFFREAFGNSIDSTKNIPCKDYDQVFTPSRDLPNGNLVPARHRLLFWTQHPSKGTITLKNLNWIMDSFWIPDVPVPVHLQHYNNCYYDMSFNGPCPLLSQVERGHFG